MATLYQAPTADPLPFRDSHPLAFSLYDQDGHYVLYIANDPAKAQLILELRNTSAQPIELALVSNNQTASAQNYHIQLKFRAEVLAPVSLAKYQNAVTVDGWSISAVLDATSQQVTFYLLATQNTPFANGETRKITLNLSAAASAGERGTQVEMLPNPQQVHYISDKTQISGSQLAHLQIISHQGLRNIPLHVGFVGSNRVLNDGSVNATPLILEITNQLHKADHGGGVIVLNPATTKLTLSFLASADDWALTDSGNAAGTLALDTNGSKDWTYNGSAPSWTITPKITKLGPGDSLKLYLSGIITTKPSGLTNLRLQYENIPGYWGGDFICQIEKAPLVFAGGKVHIATATYINGNSTRPKNGGDLFFGKNDLGIGHHYAEPDNPADPASVDKQNYAWIQSQNGYPLVLNPIGDQVGIGTKAPAARLHIQDAGPASDANGVALLIGDNTQNTHLRLGYTNDYTFVQSYGVGKPSSLKLNPLGGNVGIGTTTSSALFQVGPSTNANEFDNITTLGIFQRAKDTVGLSIRKKNGNPVLQFIEEDDAGSGVGNYIELKSGTNDLLIGTNGTGGNPVLTVGPGHMNVAPGTTVTGIPIIDFKVCTSKRHAGDDWSTSSDEAPSVSFDGKIIDAQAALISWDLHYDGSDGEYLNSISIELVLVRENDGKSLYVEIKPKFNVYQKKNYAYTCTCTILVIAKLEASY